jgi:hypothetical protein
MIQEKGSLSAEEDEILMKHFESYQW